MSGLVWTAGGLAALLALAHGLGGELTSVRALARDRVQDGDRLELRAVWHLYTWQLALFAGVLLSVAGGVPERELLRWLVAGSFLGGAVLIVVFAATRGLAGVLRHPQWVALALVGALAYRALAPPG